ncbi:unnamed protein product, partial [Musa banksii]
MPPKKPLPFSLPRFLGRPDQEAPQTVVPLPPFSSAGIALRRPRRRMWPSSAAASRLAPMRESGRTARSISLGVQIRFASVHHHRSVRFHSSPDVQSRLPRASSHLAINS